MKEQRTEIERFLQNYMGRQDQVGIQNKDGSFPKRKARKESLEIHMRKHLDGDQGIAFYPVDEKGCTKVLIWDVDVKPLGDKPILKDLIKARRVAKRIETLLTRKDIPYSIAFSGRKGYHVILVFDVPCKLNDVRVFAKDVLDEAEYTSVGDNYQQGAVTVEVLPKPGDSHVKLPAGLHQVSGLHSRFIVFNNTKVNSMMIYSQSKGAPSKKQSLQEIKSQVIKAIIDSGVTRQIFSGVKNVGEQNENGWVQGLCPFHDDTRPSFSFSTKEGLWRCFTDHCSSNEQSSKPKGLVEYVMRSKGASFREALIELASLVGMDDDVSNFFENSKKPTIVVSMNIHKDVEQAIDALANVDNVYQRSSSLTQLVLNKPKNENPYYSIREIPTPSIKETLSGEITWLKEDERGYRQILPPDHIVAALSSRGSWPKLPLLENTIDVPVLRPDGTIISEPGYDEVTGLFYAPSVEYPKISSTPSRGEAMASLERLKVLYEEFPFADKSVHLAATLAGMMTPFLRFAYKGCTPLFLIDANSPGAGKGLLTFVMTAPFLGRSMAAMTEAGDSKESRKRYTSMLMEGQMLCLLDNFEGDMMGDASLNALLTSTQWSDRILGKTKQVSLPNKTIWYANGNNVTLHSETIRRVIYIRLDAMCENPQQREFKIKNLRKHIIENRGQIVADILTILRAYFNSGKPTYDNKPFGSFEDWSDLVRNILSWLEFPDILQGQKMLSQESNSDRDGLYQMLQALHAIDKDGKGLTCHLILDIANNSSHGHSVTLKDALANWFKERPSVKELGLKLKALKNQVIGGLYLTDAGKVSKGVKWVALHV